MTMSAFLLSWFLTDINFSQWFELELIYTADHFYLHAFHMYLFSIVHQYVH